MVQSKSARFVALKRFAISIFALAVMCWGCATGADVEQAPRGGDGTEEQREYPAEDAKKLVFVYEVELQRAVYERLRQVGDDIRQGLADQQIDGEVEIHHRSEKPHIWVGIGDPARLVAFVESLEADDLGPAVTEDADGLRLDFSARSVEAMRQEAMEGLIGIIEERLASLGIEEVEITRKDSNQLVIEISGIERRDVDHVRNVMTPKARLSFRLIDDDGTNEYFGGFRGEFPDGFALRLIEGGYYSLTHADRAALEQFFEGRVPPGRRIGYRRHLLFEDEEQMIVDEERSYWLTYLLYEEAILSGGDVRQARAAVDEDFDLPYVAITFDSEGTQRLAEVTKDHIGQRLAIMLDDIVESDPVINEPITEGRANITMGATLPVDEQHRRATDLAISLRHGALPPPLELISEEVVDQQ